jgi:hypothetical protein
LDLAPKWRALLGLAAVLAAVSCRREGAAPAPRPDAAAAAPAPAPAAAPRGTQLTLIYSSNQLAAYGPCHCAVSPMGGLARRATQIDRAHAEADAVLVLEAGDLFTSPGSGEVERRARLMAAAYGRMGTTAFVPGERDLALGLPLLRRLIKEAGLPVVAANLYGRDGQRLFDADRMVEAKGTKVGIVGLSAPATPEDAAAWRRAGVEARDPVTEGRVAVAALRARGAQLVVALLHVATARDARAWLAAIPGVDWAVLGHVGMRTETAERAAPDTATWLLSVMPEGKELGRVDLHLVGAPPFAAPSFVDRGARGELERILADHRRQLASYDRPLGNVDQASLGDYNEARRRQISEAIARDQAALAKLPGAITGNWFEHRLIPLDATTPDQIGVAVLVDAYEREGVRRGAGGKRPVGDEPPSPLPAVGSTMYTGSAACGGCHASALAAWQASKHAHALTALARIGRDRTPSCVGCHITGFRQVGGPADPTAVAARFANVGCEACHGPGGAHAAAAAEKRELRGTLPPVAEATCRGCHTHDRSFGGDFDYARLAAKILGPGHGHPPLAPKPAPPL